MARLITMESYNRKWATFRAAYCKNTGKDYRSDNDKTWYVHKM